MQDQRIRDEDAPQRREECIDSVVLDFMLTGPSCPWSLQELARELGNPADAEDAVARLAGAGLVHRLGEFVFPTRAARRAEEVQIGTV
jgi:hypothetical protein